MISISNKIKDSNYGEFLLITLLAIFLVASFFYFGKFFTYGVEFIGDSVFYLQISNQPSTFIEAPFSYRVLTPLLVYLLPLEHYMGFIVVNLTAIIGTTALFYYFLKKLNFSTPYRILGSLFFILSPSVLYSMINTNLIDPLSYLFFLLAFYAILTKNDKLFLIALVLGVLNKETIFLVIPLFFIFKLDKGVLKALKSTLIISIPPIILFVLIRVYLGLVNYLSPDSVYSILSYHLSSAELLNTPFPAFGTLWIISLLNLTHIESPFIKKSLYLIPIILLQIFIATDTFRALFLAFPIIIPLSLYLNKTRDKKIILVLLILSITILISYLSMYIKYDSPLGFIFLPLEIIVTGFLLILFIKNKYPAKK